MNRKIVNSILLSLLAIVTIWLGFRLFNRISHPKADPMDAVPCSAAVIIQSEHPLELWKSLVEGNLMWDDLRAVQPFTKIHGTGKKIDSLFLNNPEFATWIADKSLIISLHPAGNAGADYLISLRKGNKSDEEILNLLDQCTGTKSVTEERKFQAESIRKIKIGNEVLHLLLKDDFISIASSGSLIEEVVAHLESGKKIQLEDGWKNVAETSDLSAKANFYIHHQNFSSLVNSWLASDLKNSWQELQPYGKFSALDLNFSSSTFSLNGFTFADSSGGFLSLFENQQAQDFQSSKILPENTAGFLWLGINDGESFYTAIENRLKIKGTLNQHQKEINQFNSDFDVNLKRQLLSWVGNEIVLFSDGTDNNDSLQGDLFLAIKINEISDPLEELNELSIKLDSSNNKAQLDGGMEVRRLNADDLFSMLLGDVFSGIDRPWYMRVEDYMIFANSLPAIQRYLKDISTEKSLAKNITYYNFVSENLSDKANITVYANPSRIGKILSSILSPKHALSFSEQEGLMKKFDAFAWQLSNANHHLFYNNVFLKFNPGGKQDSKSLWELALDTTVSSSPIPVRDHMSGQKDLFVQDDNYTIYLISSKGEVLWKKALEEKIRGDIRQIDFFGNGKLQLLFCTSNQLHLIDLKGNYMSGFPVRLNGDVSGEIGVFDYESNQNYRILIPLGNKIVNVDKEGKIITGWEFEGTQSTIRQAPAFFRCENKDYLFITDIHGDMHIVDRKGKTRYNLNFDLENLSQNQVLIRQGSTIESTSIIYSDSTGKIYRRYFNGNADTAKSTARSPKHLFRIEDLNEDGKEDIILLDSNKVEFVEWNGKVLGRYSFADEVNPLLMSFKMPDGSVRTGLISKAIGEIYLLMGDGTMHPKFPLKGTTSFIVSDINNDGNFEIVTGTGSRRIICYSFN